MRSIERRIGLGLLGGAVGLPDDVPLTERSMSPLGPQHHRDEGATDALGRLGYEKLAGHAPSRETKSKLSWAVHIGYGLLVAGLYGAGLWLLGDELVVPLLGLSDKPRAYPASQHLQSLAQHLGFGVATAATTRALVGRQRHWWS